MVASILPAVRAQSVNSCTTEARGVLDLGMRTVPDVLGQIVGSARSRRLISVGGTVRENFTDGEVNGPCRVRVRLLMRD